MDIDGRIREAETRWPHLRFKRKTPKEAASSCPFCHQGEDRFLIFDDGGYWCRVCDIKGWLDEEDDDWQKLDPTERRLRILEAEQRRARREREEMQREIDALKVMAECKDHLRYHKNLSFEAIDYWRTEGMSNDTIDKHKLGYCDRCPTDRYERPSYTIPVFDRDGTTLINIRHRLIGDGGGGKYRPHMAGLPVALFNARHTVKPADSIIIAEGEKKSLVLEQYGFPNVAIMGKRAFKREWLEWLASFGTVYVALDPDAVDSAQRLAALFNGRGRVVDLPCKIDDMIVKRGATPEDIRVFLHWSRPVAWGKNGKK